MTRYLTKCERTDLHHGPGPCAFSTGGLGFPEGAHDHGCESLEPEAYWVAVEGCGVVKGSREEAVERMARAEYEASCWPDNKGARWVDAGREVRRTFLEWAAMRLAAALGEQENR